jgi:hypothetical protein
LIRAGRITEKLRTCPTNGTTPEAPTGEDDRSDIPLRGFWAHGTDCIVDVHVTNTDDKSTNRHRDPSKVIQTQEKEKKWKHVEACLEQHHHFTPFVCSTDRLLGREATTFAKQLSAKLASKWQQSYSQVCRYVNACLRITIARATYLCL